MNDKRNSDLFVNEPLLDAALSKSSKSYYRSNQSLNSINSSASMSQPQFLAGGGSGGGNQPKSSVIICHFDFFNYEFNHEVNSLSAGSLFTKKDTKLAPSSASLSETNKFISPVYHGHYGNGNLNYLKNSIDC